MKRLLPLVVGLFILFCIYSHIEISSLLGLFKSSSPAWATAGLMLFIPTTLLSALRLKLLSPAKGHIGIGEIITMVLAASSLNMILPSKMGDIAKGCFIADNCGIPPSDSLSLVIFEKTCDLLGLLAWCVLGLSLYLHNDARLAAPSIIVAAGFASGTFLVSSRQAAHWLFTLLKRLGPMSMTHKVAAFHTAWMQMLTYMHQRKSLMATVAALSVGLWFVHLLQIWVFIRMLNATLPFQVHLGLTPIAVLTGLLPFTFAGIGTRDAALIYFLGGFLVPSEAAALGILCTLRYLLPALAGLPYLNIYIFRLQKRLEYMKQHGRQIINSSGGRQEDYEADHTDTVL